MASERYSHFADMQNGRVRPMGIRLTTLELPVEEVFSRFLKYREWDVSEISVAKFSSLIASGDTSIVGIPVFPCRAFRHSSMYVRADSPLHDPGQLRGRRVGLPEWAQTASVYTRGLLEHEYGVALTEVDWVQAGLHQPGRVEKVRVAPPAGIRLTVRPHDTLEGMLLDGELDAVFTAHPPDAFSDGSGRVVRLLRDAAARERDFWRRTGLYPIMHTVAVRREIVDAAPWVLRSLYDAFCVAKDNAEQRMEASAVDRDTVPWLTEHLAGLNADAGGRNWRPYGVRANWRTLEYFLRYAHEQGVTACPLTPRTLFADWAQSASEFAEET
jgi:4,5-dihydroxyphthalate decarboxylase